MSESLSTRKRLLLAWTKLKRDAGPESKSGPSIAAVAREAGVSHTLIHTKYPDIAEKIRIANGKGPQQRAAKQQDQVRQVEDRAAELREQLAAAKKLNSGLASENARLTLLVIRLEKENAEFESGVHVLRSKSRGRKNSPNST